MDTQHHRPSRRAFAVALVLVLVLAAPLAGAVHALGDGETVTDDRPDFEALKREGAQRSKYLSGEPLEAPTPTEGGDLDLFRTEIEPILSAACFKCHGPTKKKAGLRVDELDPDFVNGDDADWWVEVLSVVSSGDMPPSEEDLADADRARLVGWLTSEMQLAETARREAGAPTSFRRLARYEYGFALQDLLGVARDFSEDLPPDPISEDGFQNSAEVLHLSTSQLEAYLESSREALGAAVALGPKPKPLHWSVSMDKAAAREFKAQDDHLTKLRNQHAGNPAKLEEELRKQLERNSKSPGGVHYADRVANRFARARWGYNGARHAWAPDEKEPRPPANAVAVAVLPANGGLIVELGDRLPEDGWMRVRVRASRASVEDERPASLRLMFGWQASNDSNLVVQFSDDDLLVTAPPDAPETYEWLLPMSRATPRNLARGVNKMGDLPSPSEYLKFVNASLSGRTLNIHHVEVTAPFIEQWPPASHARIFPERAEGVGEEAYARGVIEAFMARAWRRPPTHDEVDAKLALFQRLRPEFDTLEEATVEVLAVVLASPNFLYVTPTAGDAGLTDHDLATRLALFCWSSVPDEALLARADGGELSQPDVLGAELERMLTDPRAERLGEVFVEQWLDLALMENLRVDKKVHRGFDARLKGAMLEEPVAFFDELLRTDGSVLDLLHSEFGMVNERLARHYGIDGVTGNHLRRVELDPALGRGGLLAQAAPLAMNSDGKDSHPLKRGVWLLESILDDPPPPPPPAVPEIDLADPRVAQMTLKERIEDHRNDPACFDCHAKIDPWGIAFENFDAVGRWRTEAGGRPVDAKSTLPDGRVLDGLDGVKAFLLEERQDQFVAAVTKKLATFALGRPLGFGDRAALDGIVREVRENGDGLATMVRAIATSDLFMGR